MREMAKVRGSMRMRDIAESKLLLWELVTHEPTVLQCFGIVEATCMAQGLFCKIDGERCGEEFQKFMDRHYVPFCRQVSPRFHIFLRQTLQGTLPTECLLVSTVCMPS